MLVICAVPKGVLKISAAQNFVIVSYSIALSLIGIICSNSKQSCVVRNVRIDCRHTFKGYKSTFIYAL